MFSRPAPMSEQGTSPRRTRRTRTREMNEKRKVIGIDFGSSQSSIAIMEIGSNIQPELLNVGGGRNGQTMPTVLALDKNDDTLRAAGNEVRQRYKEVADSSCRLVSNFKRYLGN